MYFYDTITNNNFYFCIRMASPKYDILTEALDETSVITGHDEPYSLIVWNDDVNTFEWVIETLIQVCGHSYEQAEQCSYFIHFRGKYAVKQGSYEDLKPQCDAITERGINATVEVMA
jgi:ATP-dependent Clp protease adaptor protein ClpS